MRAEHGRAADVSHDSDGRSRASATELLAGAALHARGTDGCATLQFQG